MHIHSYIIISHFTFLSFFFRPSEVGWEGRWTELAARVEKRAGSVREAEAQEALLEVCGK